MDSQGRKLLLINKYYHDVGPAGGVGRYLVQEEEDLTAAGWQVIPFAMADEHARPTPWDRFFVRARDYSAARFDRAAVGDALSLVWNREAASRLDDLISETRPDVAHLHNVYHHLSPSILGVLRRHRIPVVMTLHDLRLLCPAIHMRRDGVVCEDCRGGREYNAVVHRCVKESRVASLLAAVETAHQRARRLYPKTVKTFLCPSAFYRDKYAAWGYPADRLVHLPNFVDLEEWHPGLVAADGDRDAYVFFGRVSGEKGLRSLLDAQAKWEAEHREGHSGDAPLKLLIAGDGPCLGNVQAGAAKRDLEHVEILGRLDPAGLREALARARFSVIPSEWYENAPMAGLESLAMGIPLVGADLGGLPEIIVDGSTGAVAPPFDPPGLLEALRKAAALGPEARTAARRWAEENASRALHMEKLQEHLFDAMADR